MKHLSVRAASFAAGLALCMALAPTLALAGGQPGLSPMSVFSEPFESVAAPSRLALDWVSTFDDITGKKIPPPAYWGRVAASGESFSPTHGLWCAGGVPNASWTTSSAATAGAWASPTGWTDFGGYYPSFTAGLASFSVPELADYYSAFLSYRYLMPSIGPNDASTFNVKWQTFGGATWDTNSDQPQVGAWTAVNYPLTTPSTGDLHSINLSRSGGDVVFQFVELWGDSAEGPTIDDVSVTGYKYGPVRGLHAVGVTPTSVSLAWTKPARSTVIGAADETRSITYRVWRSRDVQPYSWTEVTDARVVGTTFVDNAPRGGTMRYIVQAWDPGAGEGYGEVEASAGVTVFVDKAPESTIVLDPASPGPDGTYVVPPTVTVAREFEGTTYWRWGSGSFVSNTAGSFQVPVPVSSDTTRTLEVYSTNTLGTPETPHKTATFVMKTYQLQYLAGAGGAISGAATQAVFYAGSGAQVIATPSTGYHFVAWSDGVTTPARTDSGVTTDLLVSATFAINTYQLHYTAGAGGTLSGAASQTVTHGGSGTAVTAVPNTGYHFVNWSDGVTTAARTDGTVTGAVTVSATFALDTYQLHYSADTGGTITGTASQIVAYGGSGTAVTAQASPGHHFLGWSDGVATAARTDSGVVGPISVTALFAVDAPNTYTLAYTASTGGSIVGASPQTVASGLSGTQVTATPATGYHFVSWSDGKTTAVRTDVNVTTDVLVSANFALGSFQLHYTAGTGGTISGAASQTVTYNGSGIAVTAVPATGHHFVAWSDGTTTATRTDGNLTADKSVSAIFALNTYQLHYTAGSGGALSGIASQTVTYGASGTEVTALPSAGHLFVAWTDGVTSATRTDSSVTGPVAVTAVFAVGVADTTPPATTWPGMAARFVAKATISLVATDGYGSGVASIHYKLDTGGETTYTASFTTAKVGVHTLYYWSVDKKGNVEARVSVTFTVAPPYATLYKPVAPSRVTHGSHFSIYGYVKPKHSSGYYLVSLYFYLKDSHGAYVYHSQVRARRYYYSNTMTKYKATVSLPHKGAWRVRAYHSDAGHSPSYSAYDYITVR
ncbi:MAG TPA: InlB B-repeat-containing protein [Propionibacteriaceae bacterium]